MTRTRPTRPPLTPHPYVPDGIGDGLGRQGCAHCPLPASRADVHTMPDTPAEVVAAEARRLGEEAP